MNLVSSKYLFFIGFLFFVCNLVGQNCPIGFFQFSSQQSIDNFASTWPGCTEIDANIRIFDGSNIDDPIYNLNGLIQIKKVTGYLIILNCKSLESLVGLDSLKSIGGNFNILLNDSLSNLQGLEGLVEITGNFKIKGNNNLRDMKGLDSFKKLRGNFLIEENNKLVDFKGLKNLSSIRQSLFIQNNPSLKSLIGLGKLDFIRDKLAIYNNDNLDDLSGFSNLPIQGLASISISGNDNLKSLQGLANFEFRNIPDVIIKNNKSLTECAVQSTCNYLASCQKLQLHGNADNQKCNTSLEIESVCRTDPDIVFKLNCPIKLYPNPVNDRINIQLTSNRDNNYLTYEIHDMTGRYALEGTSDKNFVDVSTLMAGIYCLRIQLEDQVEVFRFVKN